MEGENHPYEQAGATELVIQWGGMDDIEGLNLLSEEVLPAFA
jgi:hypothetical protein